MKAEKFELMRKLFEELIPFNRLLGMKVVEGGEGKATVRIDFREELVGNFVTRILHGGVIASVLDVVGGCAVIASFEPDEPMRGMGTVDLRVDYLRPGKGAHFLATGQVMRPGKRLASTRMELHNDEGVLIAIGTAIYRVSTQERETPINV